jgi:hypothetical protein
MKTMSEKIKSSLRMPARSIVSNRNQMRKAREALGVLPPEQREDLRFHNIGPGDSYIGLWRIVNHYRHRLFGIQSSLAKHGQLTHRRQQELERDERYLTEQIVGIYVKLLPHEKPKLNSIDLKGDPQNPLHMQVDLKGLPDEDLQALARILPKLGGAAGPEADQDETQQQPRMKRRAGDACQRRR